jgi:transposase InsO family protein
VRQVARVLEVSRSNVRDQVQQSGTPKRQRYTKHDDAWILPMIRLITDRRPTYGYRRVTQLLNLELLKQGKPGVNHKRIYRIMKEAKLLLARHTGKPVRTHDGKVITLHSDTRWCSDAFSIQCWNAERVHVAFSLDTCDREVIRYIASTIGVDGAMVRDLMVESVESRFQGAQKAPRQVQWLSDNGPGYIARETVELARTLNLDPCTTPSYSPESNGMAEAFVKTFKRDYVWSADLSDARKVMEQLSGWFEDYNEVAPHKGLKMLSPRQFRRQQEHQQLTG